MTEGNPPAPRLTQQIEIALTYDDGSGTVKPEVRDTTGGFTPRSLVRRRADLLSAALRAAAHTRATAARRHLGLH